ncbi:MAG: class I SAM-dependent methyltransferase [Bacteroidia bacterium]
MSLAQHRSVQVRFDQQVENARTYLLPFIGEVMPLQPGMEVLEIGCGEGGVLRAFSDQGARVLGVDLSTSRIATARELMADEIARGQADFRVKNVYDTDFAAQYAAAFDLIILKDTIEHIPGQERFIPYLRTFLRPGGKIFFGFPPWRMPFGGHQQICENKRLSKLPWIHLLPRPLYQGLLRMGGESDRVVRDLLEIKDTGISLQRFERIVRQAGLHTDRRILFLINPIYSYKFGWKPREQFRWLAAIPHLRDFLTTAGWYIVSAAGQRHA